MGSSLSTSTRVLPRQSLLECVPIAVYEIDANSGSFKDITHRYYRSYIGEGLMLDRDKDYALLVCDQVGGSSSYASYLYSLRRQDSNSSVEEVVAQILLRMLSERSSNGWSTNIRNKANFTVSYADPYCWWRTHTSFFSVIVSQDFEKLREVAPWVGTEAESYLFKMVISKYKDNDLFKQRHASKSLELMERLLKAEWAVEPPPLVLSFEDIDEFFSVYMRVKNLREPNSIFVSFNKRDEQVKASTIHTLANIEHFQREVARAMKSRGDSLSIITILKEFTLFHEDCRDVEAGYSSRGKTFINFRGGGGLHRCLYPGADLCSLNSTSLGYLYNSLVLALRGTTKDPNIVSAARNRLKESVQQLLREDRKLGTKLKMLKEELKHAKSFVRWKGSVKAGEKILRDTILLVERVLFKPDNFRRVCESRELPSSGIVENARLAGDRKRVELLIKISPCLLVPGSLRRMAFLSWSALKALGEETSPTPCMSHTLSRLRELRDIDLLSLTDVFTGSDPTKAAELLLILAKSYKEKESNLVPDTLNLDGPFLLIETSRDEDWALGEYVNSCSFWHFEAGSMAEFIYSRTCRLGSELAAEKESIFKEMRAAMENLLVNEELPRTTYRLTVLRDYADPEFWGAQIR